MPEAGWAAARPANGPHRHDPARTAPIHERPMIALRSPAAGQAGLHLRTAEHNGTGTGGVGDRPTLTDAAARVPCTMTVRPSPADAREHPGGPAAAAESYLRP